MKARLIATGERAPSWVAQGFAEYQKRLSHWLPFELVEIEPGLRGKGRDPRRATEDEGKRVIAALPKNAYVVALDVPGASSVPNSWRSAWNIGAGRAGTWRS
jgi:23S rRNA (pseudouridine1915-N3)-methyltransferase